MIHRVGILALQGDYILHQEALQKLNIATVLIYKPTELVGVDALIVPGGESTALLKLMTPLRWQEAICRFKASGKVLFGTCAGMILFAQSVFPAQETLSLIDISVERNAYGRQSDSHVAYGSCDKNIFAVEKFEMIFIRAPKITRVGKQVAVLATCNQVPVLVQENNVVCAAFHPEMSKENFVHALVFQKFMH